MKLTGLFGLLLLALVACTKESRNEIKLDATWNLEQVTTKYYSNNELTSEEDTSFTCTMILIREKDALYNTAQFEGTTLFPPYNVLNWNTSEKKMKVITFHTDGIPDAPLFEYTFNIEKHGLRKLVLTSYAADADNNITRKTSYTFKK